MSGLTPDAITKLQFFLGAVKKNPEIFYLPELKFFKDFVESYGGTIPPKSAPESSTQEPEQPAATPEPSAPEEESEESDLELDESGVIETPDPEEPVPDVATEVEVSEEDQEKSNEKKREAIHAYNDGKFDEAVAAYSEAITLNPSSALLYAKRGQAYLQLSKPNACIRDCTIALRINPDSATAYKFRGRAYRLLGKWGEAAVDLRSAAKIDFDEQTDEWLKEVTPNARKLEKHTRKYERQRAERELQKRQERARRAREEHARAAASKPRPEAEFDLGGGFPGMGGMPGGMPADFMEMFNDPELKSAFKDPEMIAAFSDITSNPANISKYQNNPKVMAFITKMSSKFGGMGGGGGFPGGPGGFPGGAGGFPGASTPGGPDDIGLD